MIRFDWQGVDGSSWNLHDGDVRLGLGATGLGLLKLTTFVQDNGVRDGQRATGWKADPQTLSLPMKKGYPGWTERDWLELDRAWWRSLLPHKKGVLTCTAPDGLQRSVALRLDGDGYTMDYDPSDVHEEDFTLSLTADSPWWLGQTVTTPYGAATPTPWNGASNLGPSTYISAANSIGTQTITNPGDIDAWAVWTLQGPMPSFVITYAGGHVVSGAPALALGEQLVIDTSETAKSAVRWNADGTKTRWTPQLSGWDWQLIPAGSSSAVQANITGTGLATATFQPRYFRAW